MKIGYRIFKKIIKFYLEDRSVQAYSIRGNKRVKPERIFKFRRSLMLYDTRISNRRYEELKNEMKWIEIK